MTDYIDINYDSGFDVAEYFSHLEYDKPMLYESFEKFVRANGILILGENVSWDKLMIAVRAGLVKPVSYQASDDNDHWKLKYWSPIESEYKGFDQTTEYEDAFLGVALTTLWSSN